MKTLCLCLILMLLPLWGHAEEYERDCLRLHVIAHSDSPQDQRAKLKARDAILDRAGALFAECGSAEEAMETACEHMDLLVQAACRASGQPARGETGIFPFPRRVYGDRVVPAGKYMAVRIVLGAGEGSNWWCMLYPDMCMPEGYDMKWRWKRVLSLWCLWKEEGI